MLIGAREMIEQVKEGINPQLFQRLLPRRANSVQSLYAVKHCTRHAVSPFQKYLYKDIIHYFDALFKSKTQIP